MSYTHSLARLVWSSALFAVILPLRDRPYFSLLKRTKLFRQIDPTTFIYGAIALIIVSKRKLNWLKCEIIHVATYHHGIVWSRHRLRLGPIITRVFRIQVQKRILFIRNGEMASSTFTIERGDITGRVFGQRYMNLRRQRVKLYVSSGPSKNDTLM